MSNEFRRRASEGLRNLADGIDISPTQYNSAVGHYQAVGEWLGQEDTTLAEYEPEIYPQGSFLLGTVVKPINHDYDIDLVCELTDVNRKIKLVELKETVGNRLRENKNYAGMIEPKKRCWRLNYSEAEGFHLDILPAISDSNKNHLVKEALERPAFLPPIWIADTEPPDWKQTNPKGYAEWFYDQMEVKESIVTLVKRAEIEEVPDFRKYKTPLQRAIQILKRHRDIMFEDDEDGKPISIIITTLAAHSYQNETDILDALENIIREMPTHIKTNLKGYSEIPNPTRPEENFADKWENNDQLRINFERWHERVSAYVNTLVQQRDITVLTETLRPYYDEKMIKLAFGTTESGTDSGRPVRHIKIKNPNKLWGN